MCNGTFIVFTKTCAVLDKPRTSNVLRVWDKHREYRGKDRQIDFFYIFMENRQGITKITVWFLSMKYSSISDENGNDQNPLKFSFEALNYYMDL